MYFFVPNLLWNHWTEFTETWQESRCQHLLPSKYFFLPIRKTRCRPGLWLAETFSTSPLNGIQRNLTEITTSTCDYKYVVFSDRKKDGRPGLWLAETFSTSLKLLNGIQRNLTGSKIPKSSTNFVFLGPIGKTKSPPWPLIGWDIFDFFETAERNSTKLNKKQDPNALYQVCVFRADRKNKITALFYYPVSYSNRDTLWNAWNRHSGSFMVDTGILLSNME